MKTKNLITGLLICAFSAFFTSCGNDPAVEPQPKDTTLVVSVTELVFDLQSTVQTFKIESKGDWTIESSESWCAVSRANGFGNGTIEVTVEKATVSRAATISVKSGEIKRQITVKQEQQAPKSIKFLNSDIEDGKMITFRTAVKNLVVSLELNVDHELKMVGGEWLTIASVDTLAPVGGMQRLNYTFETQENALVERGRTAVLNFNYEDGDQSKTARLEIYQQGSRDHETLIEMHKLLGTPATVDVWATIESYDQNHVHEVSFDGAFEQSGKRAELFELLKQFSQLQSLTLYDSNMPTIDPAIFELKTLSLLYLPKNQIESVNANDFEKLPLLMVLDLSSNMLTEMPTFLNNPRELQCLILSGNKIKGQIPTDIATGSQITSLFIDNNLFTGPIPAQIGNLENLATIGLNNNKLDGTIPETIGNFTHLMQFLAHDNLLTGDIPASVDNLMKIKDFNVNNNDMSGVLSDKIYEEINNPAFRDVWKVCKQRGAGFSNCKGR